MRLSERCYAVTGLAYQSPWVVNAGFIVGDEETLIVDTGANALAAATIHGYAEAVRPLNRLRVVNTEKHFDHIGGNGFFRELEIPIHGHSGIARTPAEFAEERKSFHVAFHFATGLVNPDQALPGYFELGKCRVDVIPTPGHTPTNISLYVAGEGALYCGDCLTNLYAPNLDTADEEQWLDSLDRIAALDLQAIVCGHGPVVPAEDVPEVIARVRGAIERRFSGLVT
jgi:glyoxylase-like metal-dependent hydrolase (beta-lactamase superfamily II)